MAQLLLEDNIPKTDDSDEEVIEDLTNYKGVFHDEEEPEQRYYEYGAHFPYDLLCYKLDEIIRKMSPTKESHIGMKFFYIFRTKL